MYTTAAWHLRPFRWEVAKRIACELDLPLLMGVVLARRGFADPEEARSFLFPDGTVPSPFQLGGVEEAVERIVGHLERKSRIVVHGDYDVDGISATALVVLGLRTLGGDPEWFLPSRFGHGYGLSASAVRSLAAGGPGLLLTVDCGVNYPEEVSLASSLGFDVIVTDHHSLGEVLPDTVVVHPQLKDYPGSELCGVGVALKLLHGLHVRLLGASEHRLPPALLSLLDLVALGTIADIVPLRGENRFYVAEGLKQMAWNPRPGLKALMEVSRCTPDTVDAATVAYRLAPRLNAPGRLESPDLPLKLLLTRDEGEARLIAEHLDVVNRERQEVEAAILRQALELAEAHDTLPPALVLAAEGWHEGVVGIVASRLVERYHRPVILLAVSQDRAKGSGRSIPPYDLMAGLTSAAHVLDVFGGHRQAAGLTLHPGRIDEFRELLVGHAASILTEDHLRPVYTPDAIVSGCELTVDTAEALALLAPFGAGNPPVRLLALRAGLDDVGTTRNGDHLRCTLTLDGVRTRGIGFGLARQGSITELEGARVHAGLRLELNRWNGTVRSEVVVQSLFADERKGEESLGCSAQCPYLDDPLAPPACAHCLNPIAVTESGVPDTLPGEDARNAGMQFSTIAQVVSSGEPTAIVVSSVAHRLGLVAAHVPLRDLGVRGVDCVGRLCWRTRLAGLRPDALLFVDWTAAARRSELLAEKNHLIILDPPFQAAHVVLARAAAERGAHVHLCYGSDERRFTERLLKVSLHPRTWMVPLYRALRRGLDPSAAMQAVYDEAWRMDTFPPTGDELQRAWRILQALERTGARPGEGGWNLADIPEYAEAEAEYEEAVRLCRML